MSYKIKIKEMIKILRSTHANLTSKKATSDAEIMEQCDYYNHLVPENLGYDWIFCVTIKPEKFFSIPGEYFYDYSFVATTMESAYKTYRQYVKRFKKSELEKINQKTAPSKLRHQLIEDFENKLMEKTATKWMKIEDIKREQNVATSINFIKDVIDAEKRKGE